MKESSLDPLNVTPRKLDNRRDGSILKFNENEERSKSDEKKGKLIPHELGQDWNIASHKPAPKLNILGNQKISIGPSIADSSLVPQLVPKGKMELQKEPPDGSIGTDGPIDLEQTNKVPLELTTSIHQKLVVNDQTNSIQCNINNHTKISSNERRKSVNRFQMSKTTSSINCSRSSTSMISTKKSVEFTNERQSTNKSKSKLNIKNKSKSNDKCKSNKKGSHKNQVSRKKEKSKSKRKVWNERHIQTSFIQCNQNNHSIINNTERKHFNNRSKVSKTTISINCSRSATSSMTSTKKLIESTSERPTTKNKSKSKSNNSNKQKSINKIKSKSNGKSKSTKKSKSPRKKSSFSKRRKTKE